MIHYSTSLVSLFSPAMKTHKRRNQKRLYKTQLATFSTSDQNAGRRSSNNHTLLPHLPRLPRLPDRPPLPLLLLPSLLDLCPPLLFIRLPISNLLLRLTSLITIPHLLPTLLQHTAERAFYLTRNPPNYAFLPLDSTTSSLKPRVQLTLGQNRVSDLHIATIWRWGWSVGIFAGGERRHLEVGPEPGLAEERRLDVGEEAGYKEGNLDGGREPPGEGEGEGGETPDHGFGHFGREVHCTCFASFLSGC